MVIIDQLGMENIYFLFFLPNSSIKMLQLFYSGGMVKEELDNNCGLHICTSFVDSVLFLLCLCTRLFICALWSPAGKGLTSWLSFVVSYCEFNTFP